MNMLANHDVIHHNGQGITKDDLEKAFTEFLGTRRPFAALFAEGAKAAFGDADGKIDLHALLKRVPHGGLEHDASQSRLDFIEQPDQTKPNMVRVENNLKIMGKTKNDRINIGDMVKLRGALEKESETKNPALLTDASQKWTMQKMIGMVEACLATGILSGPTGEAYLSVFGESKLPNGFTKSQAWFGWGASNSSSAWPNTVSTTLGISFERGRPQRGTSWLVCTLKLSQLEAKPTTVRL